GGATMLYTTTPDGQALTVALDGQQDVQRGANLKVYFDPARCHVFAADGIAI
ncbi:MAG: TOBE domain-containing protein, partial [Pararhizobium sp.]